MSVWRTFDNGEPFQPASGAGKGRWRVVYFPEPHDHRFHEEIRGARGAVVTYPTYQGAERAARKMNHLFRTAWMV